MQVLLARITNNELWIKVTTGRPMLSFFRKIFTNSRAVAAAGRIFPGIIAAKVLTADKHPNADRLRIIKLDTGDSVVGPVVSGAFNFEAGDMVALALPGATISQNIHDDKHLPFTLEKAKIRGVESQGMICAAFELGLAAEPGDKPEIMVLKKDIKPGSQFVPEMIK